MASSGYPETLGKLGSLPSRHNHHARPGDAVQAVKNVVKFGSFNWPDRPRSSCLEAHRGLKRNKGISFKYRPYPIDTDPYFGGKHFKGVLLAELLTVGRGDALALYRERVVLAPDLKTVLEQENRLFDPVPNLKERVRKCECMNIFVCLCIRFYLCVRK